jgi:uncharacterized protein YceH (UPF0502 family)
LGEHELNIELTINEARVLGVLMEKAVTTPDQYPMTLNALANACNQKSSRDPVLSLEQGVVQRTARDLEEKHLLSSQENFKSRVEKYTQRLCDTPFAEFQFDEAEYAVIYLLLLRGPQTPGELRTRSARVHQFDDNGQVAETLQGLIDREDGPLVARIARKAGRQDSEYAHLFYGDIESVPAQAAPVASAHASAQLPAPARNTELESRVAALEQEVRELRQVIDRLSE